MDISQRIQENFLQARQALKRAEACFSKWRDSGIFTEDKAYSKKSTDDLTAYLLHRR